MPGAQTPSTPTGNNNFTAVQSGKDEADAILGLSEQSKRRWMVKSSCCDYNEMLQMLRDCPKLAGFKDCTSVRGLIAFKTINFGNLYILIYFYFVFYRA